MTVAVCFNCGNFKHGALSACEKCGATPKSDEDYTVSMQMTDHFHDQSQLQRMADLIRSGTQIRATDDEIKMWTEQRLKLTQGPLGDIVNKLGPTERPIPAPMPERRALICELLYKQINEYCKESAFPRFDPTTPDDTPNETLFSLPQGLILLIVEQYLAAKRQNIRNYRIFQLIHENLSPLLKDGVLLKKSNQLSRTPPLNPSLQDYIRYFIRSTAYDTMDGLTAC
ncbi:MAG TPA: hypothetical protein VHY22_09565 [Chthoniobacteraceae bacterium]|jgi:hypothetical protein|nr:hypothetical protein [Chthoniobacteraceae bacterium]